MTGQIGHVRSAGRIGTEALRKAAASFRPVEPIGTLDSRIEIDHWKRVVFKLTVAPTAKGHLWECTRTIHCLVATIRSVSRLSNLPVAQLAHACGMVAARMAVTGSAKTAPSALRN